MTHVIIIEIVIIQCHLHLSVSFLSAMSLPLALQKIEISFLPSAIDSAWVYKAPLCITLRIKIWVVAYF